MGGLSVMGFFSDLKNDLTQAVAEMTDENAKNVMIAQEEKLKKELLEKEQSDEDIMSILDEVEELEEVEDVNEQPQQMLRNNFNTNHFFADNMQKTESGSLTITGSVSGELIIPGTLCFTGDLNGGIQASQVILKNAKVLGNIICAGNVEVDAGSVVLGNLTASNAVIAGALKGDADVSGHVILESSAIIKGNMKSKSIQMNNGAVIEGMFSQCYAQINPSTFFDGMES